MNSDDSPAQGVAVVVNPGEVRGFTTANGMAELSINTEAGTERLQITVSLYFLPPFFCSLSGKCKPLQKSTLIRKSNIQLSGSPKSAER